MAAAGVALATADGVAVTGRAAVAVAATGRAAVAVAVATGLAAVAVAVGVAEATLAGAAAVAETRDGNPSPPALLDETAATGAVAILAGTAAILAGCADMPRYLSALQTATAVAQMGGRAADELVRAPKRPRCSCRLM